MTLGTIYGLLFGALGARRLYACGEQRRRYLSLTVGARALILFVAVLPVLMRPVPSAIKR
jgi:hypothetical protein